MNAEVPITVTVRREAGDMGVREAKKKKLGWLAESNVALRSECIPCT